MCWIIKSKSSSAQFENKATLAQFERVKPKMCFCLFSQNSINILKLIFVLQTQKKSHIFFSLWLQTYFQIYQRIFLASPFSSSGCHGNKGERTAPGLFSASVWGYLYTVRCLDTQWPEWWRWIRLHIRDWKVHYILLLSSSLQQASSAMPWCLKIRHSTKLNT